MSEVFINDGLTDLERQQIWLKQEKYLGQLAKFKYFEVGGYNIPTILLFRLARSEGCMSLFNQLVLTNQ